MLKADNDIHQKAGLNQPTKPQDPQGRQPTNYAISETPTSRRRQDLKARILRAESEAPARYFSSAFCGGDSALAGLPFIS